MNDLRALLDVAGERHAERPALVFRARYRTLRWTHAELRGQVQRLEHALHAAGVGPGDRVLLFGGNSPHWAAACFAIMSRGAAVVPLNPRSPVEQLQRIVANAGPKLLLCSMHTPWPGAPIETLLIEAQTAPRTPPPPLPAVALAPGTLAQIIYTSGTTGDPKGVMLTHGNLLACVTGLQAAEPLSPEDALLTIVPLFHVYGLMAGLLYPLSCGSAVTYVPSLSSRVMLETFARTPATYLVAVPEFLKTVMDRLELRLVGKPALLRGPLRRLIRRRLFPSLQALVSGGAPLAEELEAKWRAFGFEVLQGYGLTETSPMISCNTRAAHRPGSVGRPIPGVEVAIAADGEILVKGANVMAGYFRDEARTRAAFQDGWLKTDDAGRLDEDGFLHVSGRKKYMLLGPGGENVFPEDLEAALNAVAGVRDSAVVGLDRDGHLVIHAVLLTDRTDGDAIVAQANAHLASHQAIMSWSLWPEADFPRSGTRKVKKDDVLKRVAQHQAPVAPAAAAVTPLTRLIAQVTRADPPSITEGTRLVADLHLDSLLRIELVSRIEEEFNREIAETAITATTTVAELRALLEAPQVAGAGALRHPRWSLHPACRLLRPAVQLVGVFPCLALLCDVHVEGREILEGVPGPVLFMANHRSYLDAPALVRALPRRRRQRLAIAAAVDPLYERFSKLAPLVDLALNTYPLATRASENVKPGLEYTGRLLDDGWSVLVFPEGQLNRSGEPLQPLRGGAGVIALEMAVPVVPVSIVGTERALPPDTLRPRGRSRVDVRFGAPLEFAPQDSPAEVTRRIDAALRELIGRTTDRAEAGRP